MRQLSPLKLDGNRPYPHAPRTIGGLTDHPHEGFSIGKGLRPEAGVVPDAAINGEDAAPAHRHESEDARAVAVGFTR